MTENVDKTQLSNLKTFAKNDDADDDHDADDGVSTPKKLKLAVNVEIDSKGPLRKDDSFIVNGSGGGGKEVVNGQQQQLVSGLDQTETIEDAPSDSADKHSVDTGSEDGDAEAEYFDAIEKASPMPILGPSGAGSPAMTESDGEDNANEAKTSTITYAVESGTSSSCSSTRPKLVLSPSTHQISAVTESIESIDGCVEAEEEEEKIEFIDIDPSSSSSSSAPTPVLALSAGSDSEIEILSSDDEELLKKRAADNKVKTHKAKQVLSSIKKLDIKSLGSRIKLSVPKPLPTRLIQDEASKGSSDGLSPIATSSPSPTCASEEEDILKKEELDDGDSEWSDLTRNGTLEKKVWRRETSAMTTESSSRCSSPCEDPLEREPEEKERSSNEETEAPREALTAKSVREAALKNAAIDDEYNVKNILHRLKAASLTLNTSVERVRGRAEDDDNDGVEIVEKEKQFCEIVLESSDEEDEGKEANEDDDDDIQVIADPNIKSLEKTQQMKVAEQLSSAGVTVKNSMPKVPKKLFPKWQTIAHLAPMEVPSKVKRPIKEPLFIPKHLQRSIKVLSLFDGISGCLVALKQLGFSVDAYVSSELDEFSKIVTMIRHPEVAQVGDARGINEKVLREHGPFDLLVAGFPCNDFENEGSLRNNKAGMHFQIFVEILKSCAKQHKKAGLSTPFHWLFYNVDLPARHRDRISSALNCDPVKLDAIHISPMRKPDFFWSNIPGLEAVLHPIPPLDRISLQECLEPDRVARVRRLNTLSVSFESMRQGQYDQVPINHGGELDHLWMVETERVLGFPDHYTDVANLPPKERLTILSVSASVPIFRHILTPLRRYYAHLGP